MAMACSPSTGAAFFRLTGTRLSAAVPYRLRSTEYGGAAPVAESPDRPGGGAPSQAQPGLHHRVGDALHPVGGRTAVRVGVLVADHRGGLGALVPEPDVVVGGEAEGREGAVTDQLVEQRAPLGLTVVVDAVAVGQQPQGVGHRLEG